MWLRNILPGKFKNAAAVRPESEEDRLHLPGPALQRLDHIRFNSSRYLPGGRLGIRSSFRNKPDYDLRDYRKYTPGDDLRYIDWKASARADHIYIKQGEQPKDAYVHILIDCSASMDWGYPPKSGAVLRLAAALGYLALSRSDRLSIVPFQEKLLPILGPISGKGQFPNLIQYLRDVRFAGGTDILQAVRSFIDGSPTKGLIFILSDFLTIDGLEKALSHIPAPSWDVVLLQMLHPEEIQPTKLGAFELVDCESGEVRNYDLDAAALREYGMHRDAWLRNLEDISIEGNAFQTLIPTNWVVEKEVISHLLSTQVLVLG